MAGARALHPALATAPRSATPRLDWLIETLTMLAFASMLAVSPFALAAIGWNYDGAEGGAGPLRFHPATYLTFLVALLIALRDGNPFASLLAALAREPLLLMFLIGWGLLFYHGTFNQKLPAATLIDTFLVPVFVMLILQRLGAPMLARLARLVHAVFLLNALIGLGEFSTGLRLTPYIAGGIQITDDWRASALLGHPLANALMTGCYTAALLLGGGGLSRRERLAMIALQSAAMVVFGGRASSVILLVFVLGTAGRGLFRFLAGGKVRLSHLSMLVALLPILVLAIGMLADLGVFDKFLLRFSEDRGSARARLVMFELFNGFTFEDLLFGPQQDLLGYLVRVQGVEFGIESLWIAFALFYGILPSALFFMGLFLFLVALVRASDRRSIAILVYFFLVNSTFLGLAGKSLGFANLTFILLVLFPSLDRAHSSSTLLPYARGKPE